MSADVPSPIDLKDPHDAREWERTALRKRPSRPDCFDLYASQIASHDREITTVLELGSGPGFLAAHLLQQLPHLRYTALDFSAAMHDLARKRLGQLAERVRFLEKNFKDADWGAELGAFDCVITHQAVHELRHKRYASNFHKQVHALLPVGGLYLVGDHFAGDGGMANDQLYMTQSEQQAALIEGGFPRPELLRSDDGLAIIRVVR